MDLILLQPGDPGLFGGDSTFKLDKGLPGACPENVLADIGPCIELVSLHYGMKQQLTTDVSNSARTSGRPIITEITLVKYVDKTSARLYEYCLRAEPIGKGRDHPTKLYILRNSGEATVNIVTISLRDAIVSEIQFQSHPDDMPTEQFKLSFTEILWTYAVQLPDIGASGGAISSGWSLARNRPIEQFSD